MNKFIIVEIIPSASTSDKGDIIQLSALKIEDLKLLDRFDYRLDEEKILIPDLRQIVSYDKENFIYKDNSKEILDDFIKWIGNDELLIIDNAYTIDYLKNIPNKKESVFKYLNMQYSDNIIDTIIDKYKLEPSNYIVDLLYEALIYEDSRK